MKKNNGYIVLTVIFKLEEGVWTAECQELGTATFGDTYEEAKDSIQEAIELHLNTLEKVGERERFFKKRKIKIYPNQPDRMHVDVPFDANILVSQNVRAISYVL
jgi:predicted RNase H-like HicB family nuclease